jgi:hypothetical protein
MEGIQSSHRFWKGLQGSRQYGGSELYQRQPTKQRTYFVAMRSRQLARMNPGPDFILDQPAGDQRFAQRTSEGERSSARRCASATEVSSKSTGAPVLVKLPL